jgi:hypothetical protein
MAFWQIFMVEFNHAPEAVVEAEHNTEQNTVDES